MKQVDWAKWAKLGSVVVVSALAVPELQAVLPKETLPYANAIIAAWALLHRYEQPKQDPPKS